MSNVVYVFDCPCHGKQSSVLCFRAFAPENSGQWKKLQVDKTESHLSDQELDVLLQSMLNQAWLRGRPKAASREAEATILALRALGSADNA